MARRMQGSARVSVPRLVRSVDRIARWDRRFHAWFRGWRDGRSSLNGVATHPNFHQDCSYLLKGAAFSENIYVQCKQKLDGYAVYLEQWKADVNEQSAHNQTALSELAENAKGIRCERPTFKERTYKGLTIVFFIAEFAFSYMNLVYSSLPGGLIVEAVLSFVCALFLIYLADSIGRRYRRFPLPLDAPKSATVKLVFELLFLAFFLVAILGGLTYLRALGMRTEDGGGGLAVELALFAIGLGFSVAAAWIAGQTEYSGPKYGTAALEREQASLATAGRIITAEQDRLQNAAGTLRDVVNRQIERVRHIYMDQYKRYYPNRSAAA